MINHVTSRAITDHAVATLLGERAFNTTILTTKIIPGHTLFREHKV